MLIFTVSCGGGGGGGSLDSVTDPADGITVGPRGLLTYSPESCDAAGQKDFLYTVMHDVYYWADHTPLLNPDDYATNNELIRALSYSLDKWSYAIDKDTYDDYYAGSNVAIGIKYVQDTDAGKIFLTLIYPGTPAEAAGLQRGYEITSVNGYAAADIISDSLWDEAFGPDTAGYTVNLNYLDRTGTPGSAALQKAAFTAHSAPVYDVYTNSTNNKKIGYLLYLNFNSNYINDLDNAMTAFSANGIEELIVDLRYNGGGLNSAASYLTSAIAGNSLVSQAMYYYIQNTKYESWNARVNFSFSSYNLNLDKIVFLTTDGTASASELVINNLTPHKAVSLVGSRTHGKPVGMFRISFCDQYVLPITFQTVNSEAEGNYFSGMAVDCADTDDLTHDLGDPDEYMLQSAISLLENGTCIDRARAKAPELTIPETGIRRIFNIR